MTGAGRAGKGVSAAGLAALLLLCAAPVSAIDLRGAWTDEEGDHWTIDASVPIEVEAPPDAPAASAPSAAAQTADGPDEAAEPPEARRLRGEIEALEAELAELEKAPPVRSYLWHNPQSGETVRQERFARLTEPWAYLGEVDPRERTGELAARLAALKSDLEAHRAASAPPPAEESSPRGEEEPPTSFPGLEQPPGFQSPPQGEVIYVTLTETQRSGFSVTYPLGYWDGETFWAKRTLKDMRDIKNLPQEVIRQLITNWSPPEWIDLHPEWQNGELVLTGNWWRYHVTRNAFTNEVLSIQTPYRKPTILTPGHSAAEPQLSYVRKLGGGYREISDDLLYGRPFHVELAFDRDQGLESIAVQLEHGPEKTLELPLTRTAEDPFLYRSAPITIEESGSDAVLGE